LPQAAAAFDSRLASGRGGLRNRGEHAAQHHERTLAMSVELNPGLADQTSPASDGTRQIGPAETFARPLVTESSP